MQPDQRGAEYGRDVSAASREFSSETMGELLRALQARAADHPDSPALIASWPGVPEARMPAACAELRRQGHAIREVSMPGPRGTVRRGWAAGDTAERVVAPEPPPRADELTVLVRELAEPPAVPLARAVLTRFAERESAPEAVRSAIALAVTEACSNVVMHAYVDADAPGYLEVSAGRANGALVVEVRDDGRGMVPRLDSPGIGVGLPLIAQLSDAFEIRTRPSGVALKMHFDVSRAAAVSPEAT